MNTISETWLPIPGYEGIYEASSTGKIKSLDRAVRYVSGVTHIHKGKILKQRLGDGGYLRVSLAKNGQYSYWFVHRLITLCFIGEIPERLVVNHKNGIKTDNQIENLEYVTMSENRKHAFDTGLQKSCFGENHHASKLTEASVRQIRELLRIHKVKDIALMYGVGKATITDVKFGRTWSHVR